MKNLCTKHLFLPFALVFSLPLFAQDVHFSQYDHTPTLTAPATVGGFVDNAYQRVNVSYRNQWQGVPVAYNSVLASFDREIRPKKLKNGHFGFGFNLLHDAAGDSKLGLTQINLLAAYHLQLNTKNTLSAGIAGGYGLRQFDPTGLRFDNQFNGDTYDKNLSARENYAQQNFGFFDATASVVWQFQQKRANTMVGATVAHLNEPIQSFYATNGERLARKYTFFGSAKLPIAERLDFTTNLQVSSQNTYFEFLGAIGMDFYLNKKRFKQTNLLASVGYRHEDAIIPMLGLRYNAWRVAVSYDINISPFAVATGGGGGPEISVQHLWYKVVKNPKAKACPVY
jgi:type IX secretion system PorP/SprF family membrane protein